MKDKYSVIGTQDGFERVITEGASFEEALNIANKTKEYFENVSISLDYNMRNPNKNILVITNCEMMLWEVGKLLEDRPEELNEQLVFLGDYISKHDGFIPFLNYLLSLKEKGRDIVFVRGVNEHNLLQAIHGTDEFIGCKKESTQLIESIEKQLGYTLPEFKKRSPLLYNLLNESYTYFEDDKYIFVSGGLNLDSYWRESSLKDLYKTSDDFINSSNNTGKSIVFGDRTVEELNNSTFTKPWIDLNTNKIGINGNIRNYGRLIGLTIIGEEQYFIGVRHNKGRQKTYAYDVFEM